MPDSLWLLFLEAIQRNPRMQKLKDIIDRANAVRNTYEQEQKKKDLETYMLQKQLEQRSKQRDAGR